MCLAVMAHPEALCDTPSNEDTSKRIASLILQLGDDDFETRENASNELADMGEVALAALREAKLHRDPEVHRRADLAIAMILDRCKVSDSTGLELVLIEPGTFQMGSPNNESGRRDDEWVHAVQITRQFFIGKYEVTQMQYESVMKSNPSAFRTFTEGNEREPRTDTRRFPVESVTWFDAVEFCNRLSGLDGYAPYYELSGVKHSGKSIVSADVKVKGGNGFRLPTEAEWEYACRAGTTTPFHFPGSNTGRQSNVKATRATGAYGIGTTWKDHERTTQVGSYPPNFWGLHEMLGNAGEWVWDWYDKDFYRNSPKQDPTGPETGRHRVLRGGSWLVTEANSRSASRFYHTPDERKNYAGFRVARTP
jgi:formylglycine-generating enzyme required for sulfatase activity